MVSALRGVAIALAGVLAIAGGCSSKPKPRAELVRPTVVRDVPAVLRGTVGSMGEIVGAEPTLVSGYGLVVGLRGTGGGLLDERVAATMERQMGLDGIGRGNATTDPFLTDPVTGFPRTPRQILRDSRVAVVAVQAVIPPGAPEGYTFDVYVRALNATSLEGGMLWTTELRFGPPSAFGRVQAKLFGEARGPIFINPFAGIDDEQRSQDDGVSRSVGRVLAGGVVTAPLGMALVLDNESHARARAIASAINSRFPESSIGRTARGRDGASITLRVPDSYAQRPNDFLNTVRALTVDTSAPEAYAQRYTEGLVAEPGLSRELMWCLVALGEPALPFVRELYEHPEMGVRMAALEAGGRLGDPRVAAPLLDVARSGLGTTRTLALRLLGRIDTGPRIDEQIKEFLESTDMTIRVAAYEALAERAERANLRRMLAIEASKPPEVRREVSPRQVMWMAKATLPGGTLQGIERRRIESPEGLLKFYVDRVPFGSPMIYVTQQGVPRIVLFGRSLGISGPMLVSAWHDRLLLTSDAAGEPPRLYYRPEGGSGTTHSVPGNLEDFISFLARRSIPEDPRPGLDFSYSDTVGALYAMSRQGGVVAPLATEEDRLVAELLSAREEVVVPDRPELADGDEEDWIRTLTNPGMEVAADEPVGPAPDRPMIVPVESSAADDTKPASSSGS
jgi:flagellar P-ring protein precursor FlgI